MKSDRLYLIYIDECIDKIERYISDSKQIFLEDTKTQDAVLRNLHTLAESVQRISADVKLAFPKVDWRTIGALWNVIVHDYLGVNLDQVWDIVKNDLPKLKVQIKSILEKINLD